MFLISEKFIESFKSNYSLIVNHYPFNTYIDLNDTLKQNY